MSFEPLQFLEVAEDLTNGNEARIRTAIGRAYYAVFLKALSSFAEQGLLVRSNSGADHRHVLLALRRRSRITEADQLDRLRELRVRADYDMNITMSPDARQESLLLAHRLRQQLYL
jgi:hypothetical protein